MIFVENKNKYYSTHNLTFRQFMQNGFDTPEGKIFPTHEHWETHLSLYFGNVRLKNYIEIRNHDSQQEYLVPSVAALWKGLLYNNDAICAVEDLLRGTKYEDFEELRFITPDLGLDCKLKKYPLTEIAKELLNISSYSLKNKNLDEEIILEPLQNIISEGITPADIIIKNLQKLPVITPKDIKKLQPYAVC